MTTGTEIQVVMPQMGVSVSEGTITKWLKQVGEPIARDEPLLEISTDKVDTEVPSPGEGVVAQILVAEGQTVDVGTVLARSRPPERTSARAPRRKLLPRPRSPRRRADASGRAASPGSRTRPASCAASAEPAPALLPLLCARRRPSRAASRARPPGTGRASSHRSSRASPPSTASIRRPSRAPGPAAA